VKPGVGGGGWEGVAGAWTAELVFMNPPEAKNPDILEQGSIFRSEKYIYSPPPSENDIFSPSRDTLFFDTHRGLFALILPYFAFILSFYFPFSHFLSPFFLFLLLFPLFLFAFSYFFPQMTLADIFSPPGGGGYFPIYRSLSWNLHLLQQRWNLGTSR
jgi:hypothetical protein